MAIVLRESETLGIAPDQLHAIPLPGFILAGRI